eukprot:8387646-Pyramimonas_sp.AAC.1
MKKEDRGRRQITEGSHYRPPCLNPSAPSCHDNVSGDGFGVEEKEITTKRSIAMTPAGGQLKETRTTAKLLSRYRKYGIRGAAITI